MSMSMLCAALAATALFSTVSADVNLVYYDDSTCSTFAGTRAFVSGENHLAQRANASNTGGDCQDNMACLLDASSAACAAIKILDPVIVNLTKVSETSFNEREDGVDIVYTSTQCTPSFWYSGCFFKYLATSTIGSTPTVLSPSPKSTLLENKQIYLMYYGSAACAAPVGGKGFVSRAPAQAMKGGKGTSCAHEMACVHNPTGAKCAGLANKTDVTLAIRAGDTAGSVIETFNGERFDVAAGACTASSIYGSCWFAYADAAAIAANPNVLAHKPASTAVNGTGAPSSAPRAGSLAAAVLLPMGLISAGRF